MTDNRAKRPNVVLFFTDQQRWDSTGVHGNPLGLTPNFDRIAKRGTHCFNAYTCQPVCGPARAALQTGMYPTQINCHTNGRPLRPEQKTLGHYFKEAGYHTGYIGKWHLADGGVGAVPAESRRGYDHWLASNTLEHTSDSYFTTMYDNDGQAVELPGYRVDALADAGIRYINARKDEPFFLTMSFIEPHFQNHRDDFPAPAGYEEQYAGRWTPPDLQQLGGTAAQHLGGYWGMCKRLDEAFGRVMDALISLGLDNDTVVAFTTDHGCHFKTRNSEYKRSGHESSSRIPMAITGGDFTGGGELRKLVSLIDLPPTLLDAAGIAPPAEMQGHSLLPLVRREPVEWQDDVFMQISESMCGRAIRHGRWKYAVIHADDKDAREPAAEVYREDYLYDLDADPYELNNLVDAASLEAIKAALRDRLLARIRAIEGQDARIEPAPTRNRGHLYDWCIRPLDKRVV